MTRSSSPNVIFILADDMGYGDLACQNPQSQIPTPRLDQLCSQGMRFTDAHAGSAVCTPSRYNVLTGRYCWRSRLKQGIIWEWDAPLIEEGRQTVGHLLQAQGYRTACLGKWHLGWNWTLQDGSHPNEHVKYGAYEGAARVALGEKIDYTVPTTGGPCERGFDTYFGVDVPNFPPYTWFENDRVVEAPTVEKPPPEEMYGHPGKMAPDWSLEAMIPEFTRRAVEMIEEQPHQDKPLFLYLPLTSPHSPIVPNEPFKGKSGAGNYGDFVCEVDWVVGEVMDALERAGIAEDTLLIFTSDNGPEHETGDDIGVWKRAQEYGHYSMDGLRGYKRDAWEGGHRVPYVARWPGVTPAGAVCDQLVGLGDLMATCAEITGGRIEDGMAEDSVSLLPLLQGRVDEPVRKYAVHHAAHGPFAVRKGDWVLIDAVEGKDPTNHEPDWFREERGYEAHDLPGELFNLGDDLAERRNRYLDEPAIVQELSELLEAVKNGNQPTGPVVRLEELSE